VVWAGVIVNNPHRNHEFIEVEARTYEYLFTKVQVTHTAGEYARVFNSGTMSTAITTLFNEGKAVPSSPISTFTLGTVENPYYPWAKTTPWTFTTVYKIDLDYYNLFQALCNFSDITNTDFHVTYDKVFDFKRVIGTDRKDIALTYGRGGNVSDYDAPLDGVNFTNDEIIACREQTTASIIQYSGMDTSTFPTYGRLWGRTLLGDELTQEELNSKGMFIHQHHNKINSQTSVVLNEKAMPIGTYSLGDTISVKIVDGPISVNKSVRVVGWKCFITNNGTESVNIITNDIIL
jgi:hypothetical protein